MIKTKTAKKPKKKLKNKPQIYQTDHCRLDLFITDDNCNPLKARVFASIDSYSRMIVDFKLEPA
jgi:hypothetical protein